MDFSEKWGQSIDEAIQLALDDLKLTIDEVEVTVLEEPTKGFLGLGAKLAKVRVEKKAASKPEKIEKAEKVVKPEVKKETRFEHFDKPAKAENKEIKETRPERRPERRPEKKNNARKEKKIEKIEPQAKPADCVPVTEHTAITFLKEIIDSMGLDLTITACMNEECIFLDIDGKDSGTMIGKRGATLDAIQYLTSLVVNKNKEKYMRVVVDAENYRAKREKTLEQLANRLADKVVRTKKSVRLEPMNPYERKVIHATLQSSPQVVTRSEGEEPYRRIIIELTK